MALLDKISSKVSGYLSSLSSSTPDSSPYKSFGNTPVSTKPPIDVVSDVYSIAKKLFWTPAEPVRLPFGTKDQTGEIRGVVPAFVAEAASRTAEFIPRAISTFAANFKYTTDTLKNKKPTPLKLPINAERIGFDTPDVQATGVRIQDAVSKGEDPWVAGLRIASTDVLDAAVGADMIKQFSRAALERYGLSQAEQRIAAWQRLGMPQSEAELTANYRELAGQLHPDKALGSKEAFQLVNEANRVLREGGIPKMTEILRSRAGRYLETISRESKLGEGFLTPDIAPRAAEATPYANVSGYLPGTREVPGQPAPVGLSMRKVEPVGFGGKPLPRELEALADEASKYKSADEFYKAVSSNPSMAKKLGYTDTSSGFWQFPALKEFSGGNLRNFYNQVTSATPLSPTGDVSQNGLKPGEGTLPVGEGSGVQLQATMGNRSLTGPLKDVETRAFQQIEEKGMDTLVDEYLAKNNNVINTDEARELFPDYVADRSLSAGVHEPASLVARKAYERLLAENKGQGNNTVIFTAGGTGAGKSTAIKAVESVAKAAREAPIIYDINLSTHESAVTKIDQALAAGYDVTINFVYRDPAESLTKGALPRAERMGRTVPLEAHMATHLGSPKTMLSLYEKYGDEIEINAIDNTLGQGKATLVDNPLDFIRQKIYNTSNEEQLTQQTVAALEAERNAGRISDKTYQGTKISSSPKDSPGANGQSQPQRVEGAGGGSKEKERGFVTSVKAAKPELLERVAGQYIPRSTDELAIKARNLIKGSTKKVNGETVFVDGDMELAERMALTGTDDASVAVATELIKHYSDEAALATDSATKGALLDRGAEIANSMARRLTELGRSVQAASILGRMTPEGQVRFAAREIQKYNEEVGASRGGILGLRKKIPELTGKQADEILTEMRAINNMPDGDARAMRYKKLQDKITDLVPTSLYKKIVTIWKAGLLTGMKTTGTNIFANLSHSLMEIAKDVPAMGVDSIASLITKKRTLALTARGISQGISEGAEKGWRYLKTGYDERNIGAKLDYKRVKFGDGPIAKALQKYEETVFGLLGAEDQPFYYGAKARSIYSQAIAEGKNLKLKGEDLSNYVEGAIENPTDEMVRYAVLDAEMAVFQNETMLGKVARGIQKLPGGEIILPFGKTPSAVATQIINYSPLGIVKTLVENIGAGKFDQRLFSQGLGRGLTGIGILFLGTLLFKKGLVTLDRPTTEKELKLWEAEGRKPNSIKIGDKYRTIQILGPAGNLLLVGGHFQKALETSGSPTAALSSTLAGGAKSFTEQTFLKGINQVIDALNDPQRSGEGYLGSTLSSAIPTIISDVARATDGKERRTETILDRIKARLPLIRESLEPVVDVLGRDVGTGNFLEVMADPTRPSKDVSIPVVKELRRLWDEGFEASPTLLGDKNGYKILTPEQNTALLKKAGEITQSKLANLFVLDEYKALDDEAKSKTIEKITDMAKVVARAGMVLELTEGLEGEALRQKLAELKAGKLLTQAVFTKYQELR